jgi:hypothetical protein
VLADRRRSALRLLALAIYAAAALVLFGAPLLAGGTRECICLGKDYQIFVWAFAWWPHAILDGLSPFYSHLIYAPGGFDVALGALVPGAALLFYPVTAITGPLVAYNVAMLLCPVLAAFTAFLLCRRLTGQFWPSLIGGWLFGFSTYMLGQLMGHMRLTLVFLIPVIVHLAVRRLAGELSERRFVLWFVIALALQFLFSAEVFVSMTLFGAFALAAAYLLADPALRTRLRHLIRLISIAYIATAVIVSPYLYYAFQPGGVPRLPYRADHTANDPLGFFVPSVVTKLGGSSFSTASAGFAGGFVEDGAYLGLPLIAIACLSIWRGWRRPEIRVMVFTLIFIVMCSLGGHLHIVHSTGIPLPWRFAEELPVLGLLLPARFVVYAALIASMLAAIWLANAGRRPATWLLAALAVVSLWPDIGRSFWRGATNLPNLFTSPAFAHVIGARDTALVLPVGDQGDGMLWQAEAHLRFKLAGGYVVPPEAPDPYKHDPIYPTLIAGVRVPLEEAHAQSFLLIHGITVAALAPGDPLASPWIGILQRLGWQARLVGGVIILRRSSSGPDLP